MANLFEIWDELIIYLNKNLKEQNKEYKFIKPNIVHNIPEYPYATVDFMIDNGDQYHTQEGIKTLKQEKDKLIINRLTTPEITFSLTFFSDKQDEAIIFADITKDLLESQFQPISYKYDIIIVECMKLINKTTPLEMGFIHKWGFDLKIRTSKENKHEINSINKVEVENLNENKEVKNG